MFINEIKDSFERSGFEITRVSYNEAINYYKYKCRYKINNDYYLAVVLNNNKVIKDENFLSISINNQFVLRNRKFQTLEDIRELLVLSIIKMKDLGILSIEDLEVLDTQYQLVNKNYLTETN